MIQKVFSQIDELNDTCVNFWEDVCNLESPSTSKDPINYICNHARDVAAFLNLEGHEAHCRNKATLIRKGIEAHASCCAKEGASAILEAAHKIIEIEKYKENDGITCNCGL